MGDYIRTTQEISFNRLQSPIQQAIEQYYIENDLGEVPSEFLFCCETTNEKKKKKGLFGRGEPDPDPVHYVATLITPTELIWARHGQKSGTVVRLIKLDQVEMRDYQYAHMIEDAGISLFGFIGKMTEKSDLFIGLGSERAAEDFRQSLQRAIEQSQNG